MVRLLFIYFDLKTKLSQHLCVPMILYLFLANRVYLILCRASHGERLMNTTALLTKPTPHPLNSNFTWRNPAHGRARRLTEAQLRNFDERGFVLLERVFSADEIAAVIAAIDPLEEAYERYVAEKQGGNYRLTTTGTITFTAHLVKHSPVLKAFAAHALFKDACHDLIGDDVRLYWDQAVYKKTGKPQE